MDENNNENNDNKNAKMVWTCSECGGHYLMLPVIIHEEYSIDDESGQEFWGDIADEEPSSIYVEKENETTGWCKNCNKEVKCVLKPFIPDPSKKDPNLLEDASTNIIKNIEDINPPDDSDIENV